MRAHPERSGEPGARDVVPAGSDGRYTYRVLNTGNTPLEPFETGNATFPSDDTCGPLVRSADEVGNDDDVLDVAEVWTYWCDSTNLTTSVTDTVTVEAWPLNPVPDAGPRFPDRNPRVTDVDTAQVEVINPAIELTTTVSPTLVLLDEYGTRRASPTPSWR